VAVIQIHRTWRRMMGGYRSERGQSVVELAVVLPVLLLILLGIAEFGRLFHAYLTVEHAAREGARLAVTGADDAEIESQVLAAAPGLEAGSLVVQVDPASRSRGDIVTVTVDYTFDFVVPLIENVVGSQTVLSSSLRMRME